MHSLFLKNINLKLLVLLKLPLILTFMSNLSTAQSAPLKPTNPKFEIIYKDIQINSAVYNNNIQNEMFELKDKEVILTFDDGPRTSTTTKVLATLNKYNAKAVFFMIGNKVDTSTFSLVKEIAKSGHAIGSHTLGRSNAGHYCIADTWNCKLQCVKDGLSFFPSSLSLSKAQREIKLGHEMVAAALDGYISPFFRFPFGESDSDLTDYLTKNKIVAFHWHIDSRDAVNPNQTQKEFVSNILNSLSELNKGVILFHDSVTLTADALELLLTELYKAGYKIVLPRPVGISQNNIHTHNSTLIKINSH